MRQFLGGFFAAFVFLSSHLLGQQEIQRDPQALAIVANALAAAGGAPLLARVDDLTETGMITYYWSDQVSGEVTVKTRGTSQFRIDATLADGVRTILLNNGSGSVKKQDGTVEFMPHRSATQLSSMTYPYPFLLEVATNSSLSITYVGLVTHARNQVYQLSTARVFSHDQDPTGILSKLSVRDLFVDPSTFFVTGMRIPVYSAVAGVKTTEYEVAYSNYQAVNGITVALSVKATTRSQSLLTIQLNHVTFNSGLTDSSFSQ